MRVIRAEDYRRMRWKNGLGETAEVAIAPPRATLEAFEWRISLARVEADGPFSGFPGIDRTLTVVAGSGFRLVVDRGAPVDLTRSSAPFVFRGESAVQSMLLAGPVTDLNVMTRRARFHHRVRRIQVAAHTAIETAATAAALFCVSGRIEVATAAAASELGAQDTVLIDDALPEVAGEGELLLIEIERN